MVVILSQLGQAQTGGLCERAIQQYNSRRTAQYLVSIVTSITGHVIVTVGEKPSAIAKQAGMIRTATLSANHVSLWNRPERRVHRTTPYVIRKTGKIVITIDSDP